VGSTRAGRVRESVHGARSGADRFARQRNGLDASQEIALGKSIMLAGPDWKGVFDLADQASQDDREFGRYFASHP
jgi:hypothetical protein